MNDNPILVGRSTQLSSRMGRLLWSLCLVWLVVFAIGSNFCVRAASEEQASWTLRDGDQREAEFEVSSTWVDPDTPTVARTTVALTDGDTRRYRLVRMMLDCFRC